MKKRKYPLTQIAEIKTRRLEEAEKILKQKRDELDIAEKDLLQKRKDLSATQKLKLEMIEKHFAKISKGTTSDVLKRHDEYMKEVIGVKLSEQKKAVDDQKKVVKEAQKALEAARIDRLKKNQELEKIHIHKKEWTKEMKKEMDLEEADVADELGTSMHARKMKKGRR
jgi:hypothetical protein